ncbi:MAG: hypothetical protein II557_06725, partial [Clostridia bacterium]|nr:hypothetical protein [Clostridia bacterium]
FWNPGGSLQPPEVSAQMQKSCKVYDTISRAESQGFSAKMSPRTKNHGYRQKIAPEWSDLHERNKIEMVNEPLSPALIREAAKT